MSTMAQEVLPFCHDYGVKDAEAFLLERLGDIPAALQVGFPTVLACKALFYMVFIHQKHATWSAHCTGLPVRGTVLQCIAVICAIRDPCWPAMDKHPQLCDHHSSW